MRQALGRSLARAAPRPLAGARTAAAGHPLAAAARVGPARPAAAAQHRTFFSFFGKNKAASPFKSEADPEPILAQNDLFHPLSLSPFEALREKGQRIRTYSICPVSYEKHHEQRAVKYECPGCGFPTHASEERYLEGKAEHDEVCPRLREVNEDEHDIRSGRRITEFENMPGAPRPRARAHAACPRAR